MNAADPTRPIDAVTLAVVRGALEQIDHVIHATVGGGIHLDVIDKTPGINCYTGLAHAARMRGNVAATIRTLTIQCFGENAR